MLTFAEADHSADLATTDVWEVSFTTGIALNENPGTVFEVVEALNGFTDACSSKDVDMQKNTETGSMQDAYWKAKLDKSDK